VPVSQIHRCYEHPLTDPHADKVPIDTRVGTAKDLSGWFVWIYQPGFMGWVYAGTDKTAQLLLDMEIVR
jgi:hypothetical protein